RFFSFGDACFFADLKNDAELPAELDPNRNHEFCFQPGDEVPEVEGIPGRSYCWPLAANEAPLWKSSEEETETRRSEEQKTASGAAQKTDVEAAR
ncbi:MAG TPA: hypothetical protein DD632_05015, partial [Oribacterium sp.]|nr:hypothetical protein [Oribacterium sp.]